MHALPPAMHGTWASERTGTQAIAQGVRQRHGSRARTHASRHRTRILKREPARSIVLHPSAGTPGVTDKNRPDSGTLPSPPFPLVRGRPINTRAHRQPRVPPGPCRVRSRKIPRKAAMALLARVVTSMGPLTISLGAVRGKSWWRAYALCKPSRYRESLGFGSAQMLSRLPRPTVPHHPIPGSPPPTTMRPDLHRTQKRERGHNAMSVSVGTPACSKLDHPTATRDHSLPRPHHLRSNYAMMRDMMHEYPGWSRAGETLAKDHRVGQRETRPVQLGRGYTHATSRRTTSKRSTRPRIRYGIRARTLRPGPPTFSGSKLGRILSTFAFSNLGTDCFTGRLLASSGSPGKRRQTTPCPLAEKRALKCEGRLTWV